MGGACKAHGLMRREFKSLIEREGTGPLEDLDVNGRNSIKMDIRETDFGGLDWICLA
jgi:hypothetical protein